MKFRKVMAAILGVATLLGSTGCKKKMDDTMDKASIGMIMFAYKHSIDDLDIGPIVENTDWTEDDEQYKNLQKYVDGDYLYATYGTNLSNLYDQIAGTIETDYDNKNMEIKDNKGVLDVTYSIIDWQDILKDPFDGFYGASELLSMAIREKREKTTVNGTIEFEKVGDTWKITKINNLEELFSFVDALPFYDWDYTPDDPEPVPAVDDVTYSEAINAYIDILLQKEESIKKVETTYYKDTSCGIYDFNNDGIPELFFVEAEDDNEYFEGYSGTLSIYGYNSFAGEFIRVASVKQVATSGQNSGDFLIYSTGKEIIVMHSYGEEWCISYESDIYDSDLNFVANYKRDVLSDYDPENDVYATTYRYFKDGADTSEDDYQSLFKDYISRAEVYVSWGFYIFETDIENGLTDKPLLNMMNCDEMLAYLKSQV